MQKLGEQKKAKREECLLCAQNGARAGEDSSLFSKKVERTAFFFQLKKLVRVFFHFICEKNFLFGLDIVLY